MKRFIVIFTDQEFPSWIDAPNGCDVLYSYSTLPDAKARYNHCVDSSTSRNVWMYEQDSSKDLGQLTFNLIANRPAQKPRVVEYNKQKGKICMTDAQLSPKNVPIRKNISSGEDVLLAHDMTIDEAEAIAQWDSEVNEWECWYA